MSFVCLWSPAWRTAADGPAVPGTTPADSIPHGGYTARPEIAATLLARAPRVAIGDRGVIWADAHGFSVHGKAALATELIAMLERRGIAGVRAGVADTPIAAELAAVHGSGNTPEARRSSAASGTATHAAIGRDALTIVPPGRDRAYVALFPLSTLDLDPRLRPLLFGIGVATCGELAALDRESIEVRLGASAVPLWKLSRADDPRLIFSPAPPEAPHASLDWVEYALKDPMRLLFVLNNLIERVCATLAATGEGARELTIEFALTSKQVHVEMIRAARPTANRRTWIRVTRARVERITLAAAVTGITVHASRIAAREAPQGDLFDRGLASSQATEDAVARLIEDQGDVVVAPQNSAHPLLDERTTWLARKPADAVATVNAAALGKQDKARTESGEMRGTVHATLRIVRERPGHPFAPARQPAGQAPEPTPTRALRTRPELLLQLAPAPLAISVETAPRRDHLVPVRYRDGDGWHEIVNVAGPERVSGRQWDGDHAYAREYFRCVTKEGVLVWIFRDASTRKTHRRRRVLVESGASSWFLHGWWD